MHNRHWYSALCRCLCGIACLLLLEGCANVHFEPGRSSLEGKALVFGRILLERSGEIAPLSVFATPVVIRNLASPDEPGMITQSFASDGRFHWALPPGRYQLSIILHQFSSGLHSYTFTLENPGTAYYFGDLVFSGRKVFDTLGGANLRDIVPRFQDDFTQARKQVVNDNPQLSTLGVEKLQVHNFRVAANRQTVYREALNAEVACCPTLAALPYETLTLPGKQAYRIDEKTKSFDFPSGRSRFLAFRLPETDKPYGVNVRSVVTPSNLPGSGVFYLFSPVVMLLDQDFKPLANQGKGLFYPVPTTLFPPRSASLYADIVIRVNNDVPRYLILYTNEEALGSNWTSWRPGFIPVAGGAIPTRIPMPVILEPAISGEIEITVNLR